MPTPEQWLEYHKRTLDYARSVLQELPQEQLLWVLPETEGETEERTCEEPRPFCIAGIIKHVCDAERYWLREVHIEPAFEPPQQQDWSVGVFQNAFNLIEDQYKRILVDKPNDPDIHFGLSRVCQHNLFHAGQATHLRGLQDSAWRGPGANDTGSWCKAVDYLADLLIGRKPMEYDPETETKHDK